MNLKGLQIALYAPFSSDRQRETSIEDQVRRCRDFVNRRGGHATEEFIFADYATSGSSLARPGFEAMMALVGARPRRIDAIVTEDVSRLSRGFADAAMIFRKLQFEEVLLYGVGDGIDTSTRHAKLAFAVKSLSGYIVSVRRVAS